MAWNHCIFLTLAVLCLSFISSLKSTEAAGYMDQPTYGAQGAVQKARRERNLDHWDSDTLAFYLDQLSNPPDEKVGYDAAVMFYAQWDTNSHALAPYWDRIANLLEAGTTNSRLIMALFDCEFNQAHAQLCEAVGITHYPTLLFLGSGPYHDTDPFTRTLFGDKSAGVMGPAPIPNTVKFQGNWQYADSILDWIRTMQALSNWHTWSNQGLGKRLRNFFLPSFAGGSRKKPLPVGIPGGKFAPSSMSSTPAASSSSSDSFAFKQIEKQVEQYGELTSEYEKIILRSSNMLDTLLSGNASPEDMFSVLVEEDAWENPKKEANAEILRNCVTELSLDYCQRMSQNVANEMVDELMQEGKSVEELFAMQNLEEVILERVATKEPYCAVLETCIVSDFAEDVCRPSSCPFANPVACQYLTACRDPSLQQEYAEALGLAVDSKPEQADTDSEPQSPKKIWGI